ncbi:MAG: hypothetical protein R3253_02030 [Longimicrobiales bacterium]|nr:hypothetical protein [Longimicrobiales bacterium]
MKTSTSIATMLLLGLSIASAPTELEGQFSIEGRAGSAIPSGELTDDPGLNQTAGLSLAFAGMYTFSNRASAYVDVARQSFNCDGCATDVDALGFSGGVKYILGGDQAKPWVRGGLLVQRLSAGDANSDWGFGADAGVGIDWLLNPSVALVPAVRFGTSSPEDTSVTYAVIDLGLHIHTGS